MPIPIVQLKLDSSEAIDLHCPACGTVVVPVDSDPNPCEHVDFISFPLGDIEYVRPDVESTVEQRREQAAGEDEEFELPEVLSERRKGPSSFVFTISWAGIPETLSVGFRLGMVELDDEHLDDDQNPSKKRTRSKTSKSRSTAAAAKRKPRH